MENIHSGHIREQTLVPRASVISADFIGQPMYRSALILDLFTRLAGGHSGLRSYSASAVVSDIRVQAWAPQGISKALKKMSWIMKAPTGTEISPNAACRCWGHSGGFELNQACAGSRGKKFFVLPCNNKQYTTEVGSSHRVPVSPPPPPLPNLPSPHTVYTMMLMAFPDPL